MESEILEKIKKLSPELKAELEKEEFLVKLDELDTTYGVKGILILLKLVLKELAYTDLADYLRQKYNFNELLAEEVKEAFGLLVKTLGDSVSAKPSFSAVPEPVSKTNPIMVFSGEDEEEIKKIKVFEAPKVVDYELLANKIIAISKLKPLDDFLMKRLQNIIVARLRDIRDELETKEMLVRAKKIGGLELSNEDAEALIKTIKDFELNDFDAAAMVRQAKPKPVATARTWPKNLPAIASEHELLVIEDDADGLPVIKLPSDRQSSVATSTTNVKIPTTSNQRVGLNGAEKLSKLDQNAKITTESWPMKKNLPAPQPIPFVAAKKIPESVLSSRNSQRPNLDGVRFEKKLAGPIEELSGMTLIDFRRISADPKIAVNKVQEKISLLGEESFSRRVEGITAWHQNEVSKFYRLLGQASMSEGKPVEDIIKNRLITNKPTLSIDEFYAIMELNKALRY